MPQRDDDPSALAAVSSCDAERELAFRRSLRGSRARRTAAALRRRRVLRSRSSALVAAAGLLVASAGAIASTGGAAARPAIGQATMVAVQAALGIPADGVVGPSTRRALRRFQRAHGLKADGYLDSATLSALGVDPVTLQVVAGSLDPRLAQIAQCESGGDPTAVSADGRYYGKYQFSYKTWHRIGGWGNPAQAPEQEQDRRAAVLLARNGTAPWPNCA